MVESVYLEELLDTEVSPSWVNAELAKAERAETTVNARWQPAVNETLSGDKIHPHGRPNWLMVGNDSLYIYALTCRPSRDGETWRCVLLDTSDCPQFAGDGGKGLAAGVKAAEVEAHQKCALHSSLLVLSLQSWCYKKSPVGLSHGPLPAVLA